MYYNTPDKTARIFFTARKRGDLLKKKAVVYLIRLAVQKLLGLLLYLAGAGFALNLPAGIYFAALFVFTTISGAVIFRANARTLAERGKVDTNSPKWDKLLLGVFFILYYFAVYLLAGLGESAAREPDVLFWAGIALTLASGYITLRATLENTYLESTARLQTDRGQRVCSTGPYAVVRHPAYSAVLLSCAALYMVFPSLGVAICAFVCAVIIIIRTALEDKMLREGLPGYAEYAQKTRFRLIPFIW